MAKATSFYIKRCFKSSVEGLGYQLGLQLNTPRYAASCRLLSAIWCQAGNVQRVFIAFTQRTSACCSRVNTGRKWLWEWTETLYNTSGEAALYANSPMALLSHCPFDFTLPSSTLLSRQIQMTDARVNMIIQNNRRSFLNSCPFLTLDFGF